MIPAERDAVDMQMLQQFFGEQGARYATFLITVIVLLIVIAVVWWMIKKALGDRLNMTDKPDRRGRPPRLGITESFTVDRQGRRLVMVRRDNVEHLIMIGGPNDFVVETNVVRGERPVVARQDQRAADSELIPTISLSTQELAPKALDTPRQVEPARQPAALRAAFVPLPPVAVKPTMPEPVVAAVKPVVVEKPIVAPVPKSVVPEVIVPAAVIVEPAKPSMSIAERIKSSLPMGFSQKAEAPKSEPIKLPDVPKLDALKIDMPKIEAPKFEAPKFEAPKVELPKVELPKFELPKIEPPAIPTVPVVDSMKSRLEDILKPAAPPSIAPVSAPTVSIPAMAPAVLPPVIEKAVVPPLPIQAPPAVVVASSTVATSPPAAVPSTAKPISKNPFDSLEEEMAKLLGRVPDGKS